MAYGISNLPATNITRLVTRVIFPAFSLLQGDLVRMRAAFFRVVRYVSLLSFPVAVITVIFAHDFVYFVLNPSGPGHCADPNPGHLRPDSLDGFQHGYDFPGRRQAPMADGHRRVAIRTMPLLLYPSIKWAGLIGVCLLSAAVAIVDFFIFGYLADRILDARMVTYARLLTPIFIYAILAGAVGYLDQKWLLSSGCGTWLRC